MRQYTVARAAITCACTLLLAASAIAEDRGADSNRELPAQWWQWALSIPGAVNPLSETSGPSLCMVGQRGSVWFLGGTLFTGGVVERTCNIPAGTSLFFPVANSVQFNTPDICGQVGSLSVEQLRAAAAAFVDGVTSMSVTLDGETVGSVGRIKSRVFTTVLPTDNVFVPLCAPLPVPAGVYAPSVDDGYYAKVNALEPGQHTLHFTALNAAAGYNLDMTYHLVVGTSNGH